MFNVTLTMFIWNESEKTYSSNSCKLDDDLFSNTSLCVYINEHNEVDVRKSVVDGKKIANEYTCKI